MSFFLIKPKCCICKGKDNLLMVRDFGIYGDDGRKVYYHKRCIHDIVCDPENYNHILVDKALHVGSLIRYRENESVSRKKIRKKHSKELCRYLSK